MSALLTKELNAAFADAKHRERLLKRVLPAMTIIILYFVFVSGNLTQKANKAEQDYKALRNKGVSDENQKSVQQQFSQLQQDLAGLKNRDDEVQRGLAEKAGFLFAQSDNNSAVDEISKLMEKNGLRLLDQQNLGDKKLSELPKAYSDLKKWIDLKLQNGDKVRVYRFVFTGSYVDAYEMLKEMALSELPVMPVFWSMKNPEANDTVNSGLKLWTLDVWV
jgi:hypothetical protein